jgi:alkylhydroperoxidase family enzyme
LLEDDHVTPEFATLWPTYDLDGKTRALLAYAQKLTEAPLLLEESDFAALRTADWSEQAIYEATALTASFNMTGRLEAVSGLPLDQIPTTARWLTSLKQEERGHDEGVS